MYCSLIYLVTLYSHPSHIYDSELSTKLITQKQCNKITENIIKVIWKTIKIIRNHKLFIICQVIHYQNVDFRNCLSLWTSWSGVITKPCVADIFAIGTGCTVSFIKKNIIPSKSNDLGLQLGHPTFSFLFLYFLCMQMCRWRPKDNALYYQAKIIINVFIFYIFESHRNISD